MTKRTIEDALTRSNPWTTPEEPGLRAELSAFVTQSRVAAPVDRKRKFRRQLWLVPIAGAGALALTVGAIVALLATVHFSRAGNVPFCSAADRTSPDAI